MKEGMKLVSGGTDNRLMLMDLGPDGRMGKEVENLMDAAHITANKNTVPSETRSPFVTSGIRLGTSAATTRGLVEADFEIVATLIAKIVKEGEAAMPAVQAGVAEITKKYPMYE